MRKPAKEYFTRPVIELSTDASGKPVSFRQLIAVIVLFSAAAHIDGKFNNQELRTIIALIVDEFNVTHEYANELYEIAEYLLMDHKNIKNYVDVINESYNDAQKRRVYELVMKITAVDGGLAEQEGLLRVKVKRLFKITV